MPKNIRFLLGLVVAVLCAAEPSSPSQDLLDRLTAAGEKHVEEEIKQTLEGLKQVKVMMDKKEEKHKRLMDALRHSSDKKMGTMQLVREMELKLEEAEQECRDLTKSSLEECKPCLEDSCKAFYTSTCRRGYASFSLQVDEFFKKMVTQTERKDRSDVTDDQTLLEVQKAETSFGQLLSNISVWYNHSIGLVKRMQKGPFFLDGFGSEIPASSPSALRDTSRSGFFKTFSLDHIFFSAYDFGKEVLEDFSSSMADVFVEAQHAQEYISPSSGGGAGPFSPFEQPIGYLCRQLRRQVSECWQLQSLCEACKEHLINECPHVQPLHSEMEEMQMLLNASRQQYNDRLLLVQTHTADTQKWLTGVQDKYGWVSQLPDTPEDSSTFRVISVNQGQQTKQHASENSMVVSILGSAPITVQIMSNVNVDDPAFIQAVVQEALKITKQQVKGRR